MSETKKRNMRTRKEKTVARKAEVPKAEATTAGIAFGASDGGITTGVSNGISVGAYDSITTGISNGSAVGISDGMVADITRGISVGASDGIPDVIATSASEGISDGTSAGVSATIGASVPSAIPAGVPAAVNQTCGKGLKELTAEWMQLERKTLEQRKDAARFYDEHLMKPIEDEFVRNNQDMVFEDVEYMVISVGTSYEPIVLDIQLLKPAKILFLYTETSQDTMAKVIGYCGLSPNRYDKSLVSEVDPMDTYREIKSFYLRSGKPGKMYIDFTGGTKAMSAAATLAGAMIDVQMVYCSTDDYLVDFRKQNPGSERLIYIENPLAVFGELEIEKAFELFDKKNFAGAKEKFSVLKENLPDPALRQQLGFVCLLATAYEAWDALDFVPAYESMQRLQKEIERDRKLHRDYLLMDCSMHIDRQRAMLENLRKIPQFQEERNMKGILEDPGILHALALTLYQNARTREMQEKYDMATLLLYRLLEMMSQRRLIRYGIFASRPDVDCGTAPFVLLSYVKEMNKKHNRYKTIEMRGNISVKKFFMITPLQPVTWNKDTGEVTKDLLRSSIYQAAGNKKLVYGRSTRFPLIPLINGYAEEGEEIRVIAVTPDTESAWYHVGQLGEELEALRSEKGFICGQVEAVSVTYAGDVDTQIEIFHKILPYIDEGDIVYGCLTYGNKPMPIAELMALQYGYRILKNVSIGCLVYGEVDHSKEDSPMTIFDITALVQLDEIVRVLAERRVKDPKTIIDRLVLGK